MRSPLTTSFIAFRPRIDEVLEPRNDPLVSVMEKAQVMWSFHDAYLFFYLQIRFIYS